VSGPLANKPYNGGAAWTRLSWTLGFRQVGWRVFFLEQLAAATCVDSAGAPAAFADSANLAFFQYVTRQHGLAGSAALIYEDGAQVWGATYRDLIDLATAADLLVNISGHLTIEPLLKRFSRKVYLDQDPGFTQIWRANGIGMPGLESHDSFFTVGENIGSADCWIPTGGIPWRPIRQPIVLDDWPVSHQGPPARFTSVASWRGPYGPLQYEGVTLGLKVHEFRTFIRLPEQVAGRFELALDIDPADEKDRALLGQHHWRLVDPKVVARTPALFRHYVQTSAAECSVAQGVYVHTRSGWFSDRTVRYLASGKPALVQDTGFTRRYPSGKGLVAFTSLGEAVDGAEQILRQYPEHSKAARALAEEHFAAPKVLSHLLNEVGLG
jgi:hypothetical protein